MKLNLLLSFLIHALLIAGPIVTLKSVQISIVDSGKRIQITLKKNRADKQNKGKNLAVQNIEQSRKAFNEGVENNTGQKNKSEYKNLFQPAPKYPALAKVKGWQGKVLVKVFTDEQGKIIKRELIKSSGFDILDSAAMDSLTKWKTMANLQGETVPFVFKLTQAI